MSKRFGRQQKRKFRAKVEALENQVVEGRDRIERVQRQAASAIDVIEVVRKINPNSIALAPAIMSERTWQLDTVYNQCQLRHSVDDPIPKFVDMRIIDLYDLELELINSPEFMDAVHVKFKASNPGVRPIQVGYKLSKQGLKFTPIENIVHQIARPLAIALQACVDKQGQ